MTWSLCLTASFLVHDTQRSYQSYGAGTEFAEYRLEGATAMRTVFCILLLLCSLAVPLKAGSEVDSSLNQSLLQSSAETDTRTGAQDNGISRQLPKRKWVVWSAVGVSHAIGGIAGYEYLTSKWGEPAGSFHFKDELHDGLALNDEVSHLFVAYKLTELFSSSYKRLGFSARNARLLGTLESALIMTAVEFPLDAYNPDQGMGLTDLAFDYAGAGMGYLKMASPGLRDFDLKISAKSIRRSSGSILGDDASDYDSYIYWLTFRRGPAVVGVGYSSCRLTPSSDGKPQLFLGLGSTIPDLIRPISSKVAGSLKSLELYFFNVRIELH